MTEDDKCKDVNMDPSFTRVRVFVGIYLLTSANCVYKIWGNLSVYVISYLHLRVDSEAELNAALLPSINATGWGLGMFVCHKLTGIIGKRPLMMLAIILHCGSVAVSHFTIQYSFKAFLCTFGFMTGVSFGILHALSCMYVIIWCRRYLVFATSFVTATELFGSCLINIMFTTYINPKNLTADGVFDQNIKVFSQSELLDKVPDVFFIHSLISLVFGVLAFCLIKDKPSVDNKDMQKTSNSFKCTTKANTTLDRVGDRNSEHNSNTLHNGPIIDDPKIEKDRDTTLLSSSDQEIINTALNQDTACNQRNISGHEIFLDEERTIRNCSQKNKKCLCNSKDYKSVRQLLIDSFHRLGKGMNKLGVNMFRVPTTKSKSKDCTNRVGIVKPTSDGSINARDAYKKQEVHDSNDTDAGQEVTPEDMTLCQAFRTKAFYILIIMVTYSDISMVVLLTYFKSFAMVFYSDDHFLSYGSLVLNIGMCFSVCLSGICCEKDAKKSLVVFSTLLCIMSNFFYLSAMINKWFYFAFVMVYGACLYAVYALFNLCVIKYFGKTHSTTIIGMSLSFNYVTNIGLSSLVYSMLKAFGWFKLFTILSFFNSIGFTCMVFGLPDKTRY